VIIFVDVGWDETNKKFPYHAHLVDGDGNPVTVQTPTGEQPLEVDGTLEAGRPLGLPAGSPVRITVLLHPVGAGLNLAVGQRYQWRVAINDETREDWSASFTVHGPS
jgi:hypothetical protein